MTHTSGTPTTSQVQQGWQSAIIGERYRYIVNELLRLNSNTHKNLNLFRAIVPVILTPGVYAAFFLRGNTVATEHAEVLMGSIFAIICLMGFFISISIVADLFSWMDYRKEEMAILNTVRFLNGLTSGAGMKRMHY